MNVQGPTCRPCSYEPRQRTSPFAYQLCHTPSRAPATNSPFCATLPSSWKYVHVPSCLPARHRPVDCTLPLANQRVLAPSRRPSFSVNSSSVEPSLRRSRRSSPRFSSVSGWPSSVTVPAISHGVSAAERTAGVLGGAFAGAGGTGAGFAGGTESARSPRESRCRQQRPPTTARRTATRASLRRVIELSSVQEKLEDAPREEDERRRRREAA